MYKQSLRELIKLVDDDNFIKVFENSKDFVDRNLDSLDVELIRKTLNLLLFVDDLSLFPVVDIIKEKTCQKFGTNEPTQEQIDLMWLEFVDIIL